MAFPEGIHKVIRIYPQIEDFDDDAHEISEESTAQQTNIAREQLARQLATMAKIELETNKLIASFGPVDRLKQKRNSLRSIRKALKISNEVFDILTNPDINLDKALKYLKVRRPRRSLLKRVAFHMGPDFYNERAINPTNIVRIDQREGKV